MQWDKVESKPGSFTKNFGWNSAQKMKLLHDVIVAIFNGKIEPVRRDHAKEIIDRNFNSAPLVPLNFFLYNKIIDGTDWIVPDQLVAQAIAQEYSDDFNYLAISALNFSRVGRWEKAKLSQAYPAPWARSFVIDVMYDGNKWQASKVNADNIETFLNNHLNETGNAIRKLATNLSFLYHHSGVVTPSDWTMQSWWEPVVFLFLDRAILDDEMKLEDSVDEIIKYFDSESLWALTAVNRELVLPAAKAVIEEYKELNGLKRLEQDEFSTSAVTKQSKKLFLTPVQRVFSLAQKQVRNRSIVNYLKSIYDDTCVVCEQRLIVDIDQNAYSEVGHVKPVGQPINGPDDLSNLLVFCPNHHKCFDRGGIWIDPDTHKIESAIGDLHFDGRVVQIHSNHDLDFTFVQWHAQFFGHVTG